MLISGRKIVIKDMDQKTKAEMKTSKVYSSVKQIILIKHRPRNNLILSRLKTDIMNHKSVKTSNNRQVKMII